MKRKKTEISKSRINPLTDEIEKRKKRNRGKIDQGNKTARMRLKGQLKIHQDLQKFRFHCQADDKFEKKSSLNKKIQTESKKPMAEACKKDPQIEEAEKNIWKKL